MNPARSMCGWTAPRPARLPMDRTHRWAAPIEALPVSAAQDRSLVAIADRVIKVLADNAVPFTVEAMQANEGSVSSRNRRSETPRERR